MKYLNWLTAEVFTTSLGLFAVASCGQGRVSTSREIDSAEVVAKCPTGVSYKNVAKPFFDEFCRGCHGASADSEDGDAPEIPHSFDSEAMIRELGPHIYEAVENEQMPPEDSNGEVPMPSFRERRALLEWLECSGATEEPAEEHQHED